MIMRYIVLAILSYYCLTIHAQVKTLPYRNGFSGTAEKAAFTSVRKGATATSDWGFNTMSNHYASHDYPVGGSSTDTVSDWLFSPPVKVTAGAVLSFRYYVYGITGSATPSDEFSIWYGKRNMNPNNGTYVKLVDFTNRISGTMNNWKDTSGIVLPFTADTGYIVFRYRATTNWFTVGVDSFVVKIPGLAVNTPASDGLDISLAPNPCLDIMNISAASDITRVTVIGMDGKVVYEAKPDDMKFSLNTALWESGAYSVMIETREAILSRRFIRY
jgi:hypothetical protein